MKKVIQLSIIQCQNCMKLNNVENCPVGGRPLCSECKTPLAEVRKEMVTFRTYVEKFRYALTAIFLLGTITFIYLTVEAPFKYYVDFSNIEQVELQKTKSIVACSEQQLQELQVIIKIV